MKRDQPDDCGELFIFPIVQADWDAPIGLLSLYMTTNGDPIIIGQIEGGELTWVEATDRESGLDDCICDVLRRAVWNHPSSGKGYSFLVEDMLGD